MVDETYDYIPELPYVVNHSTGHLIARFCSEDWANDFVEGLRFRSDYTIIDTTPAPPLPTVPGIYVPRNNVNRLGQTNTYRLSEDGRWSDAFIGERRGEGRAKYAHDNLGGLVRLEPVLEERQS